MKYRIKNWADHQHYKDRNPQWVKLHLRLLSSRDWIMWNDASRVLAVACILLASRTNGEIDASPEGLLYLQKAATLKARPNLNPLISSGFLVEHFASTTLAPSASGSSLTLSLSNNKTTSHPFTKPTPEQVAAYCRERGGHVDPQKWLAYYESNGWRVGRNPMKDWKAAVRTWERSEYNHAPKSNGAQEFVA